MKASATWVYIASLSICLVYGCFGLESWTGMPRAGDEVSRLAWCATSTGRAIDRGKCEKIISPLHSDVRWKQEFLIHADDGIIDSYLPSALWCTMTARNPYPCWYDGIIDLEHNQKFWMEQTTLINPDLQVLGSKWCNKPQQSPFQFLLNDNDQNCNLLWQGIMEGKRGKEERSLNILRFFWSK